MDLLKQLEGWYQEHCDGDWEHSFGIRLETLDNPGWRLQIDLTLTPLEALEYEVLKEKSNLDWYSIQVANKRFIGMGGPGNLEDLLRCFLEELVPQHSESDFEYEILVPLHGAPLRVWTKGLAKRLGNGAFELLQIDTPNDSDMLCESLDQVENWIRDFKSFQLNNKVGDVIQAELVETFQGVRLAVKPAE